MASSPPARADKAESAHEATQVNGDAKPNGNEASSAAAPVETDTEMKDADEGSGQAAAPTNGTPASSKKVSNGSSKKKSSGVPEHKTKKVNKKRSKAQLTHLDAEAGEYYFARMKGHPPWPAVICDEEMLPQSLLGSRPVTTKQPDGSYKKAEYADGGKRAHERTFPVMFLHTNEFAWVPNTELTPLEPDQCKDADSKGKKQDLVAAYAIAAEAHSLDYYKGLLNDHQAALEADKEAKAERDAKKAKKSRKSVDTSALAEDADEMDVDEEVAAEKPKTKKRKKEVDSDEAEEKPAKTPKTGTKLKLSTPRNPVAESSKKAAKTKGSTAKKGKKAVVADEDDDATNPQVEEEPKLTPAQQKEKNQKMVLYWRHKLQRGFLSRDTDMSDFLGDLESYQHLDGAIIRSTKIHKVLKAMLKLDTIPLDEEYEFTDRCKKLLGKWTTILESDPTGGVDKDDRAEAATTADTANGGSNSTEDQAQQAENSEAAAPEEENEEAVKSKIGTTTEGENQVSDSKEQTAEEKKTDGPAVDSAPAEEYEPPAAA
ncbi:MAG: hypothetical protein Q9195_001111 [Heterodermia aff. obscurata]